MENDVFIFDYSIFYFTANTIDGKILEFPQRIAMRCDLVQPLYQQTVREYNGNECIVAIKVYMVMYAGHLYGTKEFTNMAEFVAFRNDMCLPIELHCCYVTFGGCQLKIGDNFIKQVVE